MDADKLKTPYMYLQDSDFAKLLIVTLPETTPVTEASKLQDDLRRAGIVPFGWVMNQSISTTAVRDPLLVQRAQSELPLMNRVKDQHAKRLYSIPWINDDHIIEKMVQTGSLKLKL
jgi:arsenite-transporting ATPase